MKTTIHRAGSRGHADHGWLNTYHTFSFANYYDPERMHFGALRVLNDDSVEAGAGFGTHPHDNMEIISIPLYGDLEHEDSMGNKAIINEGDIQVMSAGTGVFHSEKNKNEDKEVRFLQIWIFPKKKNLTPRYDQISLQNIRKDNELYQILSPNPDDQGVWIHQDAWFHMGELQPGWTGEYNLKGKNHGVYVFVLDGNLSIAGQELSRRDGITLSETLSFPIEAKTDAQVLIMEVPMEW